VFIAGNLFRKESEASRAVKRTRVSREYCHRYSIETNPL